MMNGSHSPYWVLAGEMMKLRRSAEDTRSARRAALGRVAAECGAPPLTPGGGTQEALTEELTHCADYPNGLDTYLAEFSRGYEQSYTWREVEGVRRLLLPRELVDPCARRTLCALLESCEQAPRLRGIATHVLDRSGAGLVPPGRGWEQHNGSRSEVPALLSAFEDVQFGGKDEPHPLLVFVETVAVGEDAPLRGRLRTWSEQTTARLDCSSSQLEQLRREVADEAGQPLSPYRLLVEIIARPAVPDDYTVRSWVVAPGRDEALPHGEEARVSAREAMEEDVAARYLSCVERLGEHSAGMRVEFLLPRHLLWLPVDQIVARPPDSVPRRIGADHTVLVRSRDRWAKPQWRPMLKQRARLLDTAPDTDFASAAVCVVPYGEQLRAAEVLRLLRNDRERLGYLLLDPPPYTGGLEGDPVNVLLEMGIPMIIGVREIGGHPDAERETRRVLAGRLRELPERVRLLRGEVGPDGGRISVLDLHGHVSLVWDSRDGLEAAYAALGHPQSRGGVP